MTTNTVFPYRQVKIMTEMQPILASSQMTMEAGNHDVDWQSGLHVSNLHRNPSGSLSVCAHQK